MLALPCLRQHGPGATPLGSSIIIAYQSTSARSRRRDAILAAASAAEVAGETVASSGVTKEQAGSGGIYPGRSRR